jgi:hypothetical protein
MSFPARAFAIIAALLLGAFVVIDRYQGPLIAGYLGTIHFRTQDLLIWFFGLICVIGAIVTFVRRGGAFDWRWALWLVIGGAMIVGELGDVGWLKEATCQVIYRHHYGWDGPCY